MRPPCPALLITDAEREVLEALARAQTATHGEVNRAKALLAAAEGMANTAIAAEVDVSPATVTAWRARFEKDRLANFAVVSEGRGRKPSIPAEKIEEIVNATLHSKPPARRIGAVGDGQKGRSEPGHRAAGSGLRAACSPTGPRPSSSRPTGASKRS